MKVPMLTVKDDYEPIPPAKPTKVGFYLSCQKGEDLQIVQVVIDGDQCIVYMPGSADWVDLDGDGFFDENQYQWAGPLKSQR